MLSFQFYYSHLSNSSRVVIIAHVNNVQKTDGPTEETIRDRGPRNVWTGNWKQEIILWYKRSHALHTRNQSLKHQFNSSENLTENFQWTVMISMAWENTLLASRILPPAYTPVEVATNRSQDASLMLDQGNLYLPLCPSIWFVYSNNAACRIYVADGRLTLLIILTTSAGLAIVLLFFIFLRYCIQAGRFYLQIDTFILGLYFRQN